MKNSNIFLLAIISCMFYCGISNANTYVVVNGNNNGAGSLRDAINLANSNPGADNIVFNIAAGGPQSISITSALFISGSLTIDGSTQPGWSSNPIIKIGENLANDGVFWVNSGFAVFKYLDVSKTGTASGKGFFAISSSGCMIQNCWARNRDDGVVVRFAGTNAVTVIDNDLTDSGVNGGSAIEFAHMNGNIISNSNTFGGATLQGILLDVVSNITIGYTSGNIQVGNGLKEISVPIHVKSGTNIAVTDLDLAKTGAQGSFGIFFFGTNGVTVTNCIFKNRYPGFSVRISKNLNISCNLIERNQIGIEFDGLTAGTQNIVDNNFICNKIAAAQYGTQLVTAQFNFWNSASSPPLNGFNGYSGKVDVANWLTAPALCAPSYIPTCAAIYSDPSTYVTITCPANITLAACQSQTSITSAFNQWLATASFSGGCNSALSNNNIGVPSACGGIKKVTFTVTSLCELPKTCSASFTIISSPLELICANDVVEDPCQTQAAIDAKFNSWLATTYITGGCNVSLIDDNTGSPSACGGNTTVSWTATSTCEDPITCSASFSVTNAPGVVITCPMNAIEVACQSQAVIDAKFAAWLATASFSGGCSDALMTNDNNGAPSACGGATTVNFKVTSSCENPVSCASVFKADSPLELEINCPANQIHNLCQTQTAIDILFATWLASASATGGCNTSISHNGGNAPSHLGGSVSVTWTASSSCSGIITCSGIFTVSGPDSDCDGIGDACDVCPGGDDKVDNNGDGLPDCKYPPDYADIISAWKCGFNKVSLCHINNQGVQQTLCINYNALQNHINHGDYLGPCGNAACGGNQLGGNGTKHFLTIEEFMNANNENSFISDEEMDIYPNPAQDILYIRLPFTKNTTIQMQFMNSMGQILLSREFVTSKNVKTVIPVHLEAYTSGLYFVQTLIEGEKQVKLFSIVK